MSCRGKLYLTSKSTRRRLSVTHIWKAVILYKIVWGVLRLSIHTSLPSAPLLDYMVDESPSKRLLGVTINNDQ